MTLSHGSTTTGKAVGKYRPSMALDFGSGIDRQSGVFVQGRGTQADLRNIHLYEGKAQLRRGSVITVESFETPEGVVMTHIIGGQSVRAENSGIVVGYCEDDRSVHLFRVTGEGEDPEHLYEWFTHNEGNGTKLPVVHTCEAGRKAFFAHDEYVLNRRAPTVFYSAEDGQIYELRAPKNEETACWAAGGLGEEEAGYDERIRFRGVVAWRSYLVGWGFGDNRADRPEVVRITVAGLTSPDYDAEEYPVVFEADHYWIVGQPGEAVLRVDHAGGHLLALKQAYAALLVGDSWRDFGAIDADLVFGIAGPRLAVHLNGVLYLWTLEGPGLSTGGPIQDLSQALDLFGEEPTDLVPAGAWEDGFACYQPERREIMFVFGQRGYVLSLINPQRPRWSYREFGAPLYSGFILYHAPAALATAPTGHPEFIQATPSDLSAEIEWSNHDQFGDERVELWYRTDGAYALAPQTPQVTFASTQKRPMNTAPGTKYDVALRYRRGALYHPDYESADPDTWPAVSRGSFTSLLLAPENLAGVWSRVDSTTEKIVATWENRYDDVPLQVRINNGEWTDVAAGTTTYEFTTISGEQINKIDARYVTDAVDGVQATVNVWGGPVAIPEMLTFFCRESLAMFAWQNSDALLGTECRARQSGSTEVTAEVNPGITLHEFAVAFTVDPEAPAFGDVRHWIETAGVKDYSDWSEALEATVEADP